MSDNAPVALITGANRGIGQQTARELASRGWTVVVTAREAKAEAAAAELSREVPQARVVPVTLDVCNADHARDAARFVQDQLGRLDALVNNAGAIQASDRSPTLEVDPEAVLRSIDINAVGAFRVTQAMAPLLVAAPHATVVNVSSGMGSLTDMGAGHPGYRLSKASLNALTKVLHHELHPKGVCVNAVCPGWVRTEMGGPAATRSVAEGAAGIVWAATLGPDGPSGGFFRDGEPVPF